MSAGAPPREPIPLVIDTDPGIDDAIALLLALTAPEARVLAVTSVFGNMDLAGTTRNARRILALANRADVPLAAGAARPLVFPPPAPANRHHADGLGGQSAALPAPGPLDSRGAVGLLADVLGAAERAVTLVSIGPKTNIALLLASYPELASRVSRIVAMGGRLAGTGGGAGAVTASESNLRADPEAAHRVLTDEPVPLTLVPVDLTLRCALPGEWLDELASYGPKGALLAAMLGYYRDRYRAETGLDHVPAHDALAVLEALLPGSLSTEPRQVAVACCPVDRRGALLATPAAGKPRPARARLSGVGHAQRDTANPRRAVQVAVDVAGPGGIPGLHAEILRRLRALGPASGPAGTSSIPPGGEPTRRG